ncbi:MAG: class I SAM-dependent methyltransferase [Rubrivivax sp.]|nr:class I SAM-dependent methyltransferase [Rubrivivax sp.]
MARSTSIIELGHWATTAPGRYLFDWEQARLDEAVADAFGFHALQLGLPGLEALRANRMPQRWLADETTDGTGVMLCCEFDALPFASDSLDLIVLPHALEFARDPHLMLREVERVLRPEGRIVITGFNPTSLFGLRQRLARTRLGLRQPPEAVGAPREGSFIGYWRMRDWLRLLGFAIEGGQFGCWRPPLRSERWLARLQWLDRVGERWWPVLGAAYLLVAVKRVQGMRLVGLARRVRRSARASTRAVAQRESAKVRPAEREPA